ncbi:SMB domain-containing protein [Trichonephila inaurata madagascariensis]|uniref:SMB domain-containing protein n=1 Tax=Trichonephila inaurata madagascariensis TaxID=2747483 RepID=A0A8X6WQP6_9ARAC|nr:SMB domain-containing protein [Trichonephila inaurata madagascariensis]
MNSKFMLVICVLECLLWFSSVYGQQGYKYEPYYPYQPQPDDDLRGDFCNRRGIQKCCPQRDDTCSVPILGTLCYCDLFCNRTNSEDCCPDFEEVCLGRRVSPPEQIVRPRKFFLFFSHSIDLINV